MKFALAEIHSICHQRIDSLLAQYIKEQDTSAIMLEKAMSYCISDGGKRIRPLIVYTIGNIFGISVENLDAPAVAIELIHTYSLIHDDLPAMDNADLRRGKASCHKKFGEAMAILVGDGLQSLAFEILASHSCTLSAQQRLAMIACLARYSGKDGMVAGQALDIYFEPQTESEILTMYRLKTGGLISAAVELGMLAIPQMATDDKEALELYGRNLGLAFQLQDDLLDGISTSGKSLHTDKDKKTFANLAGINATQRKISELLDEGLTAIQRLGDKGKPLDELISSLRERVC